MNKQMKRTLAWLLTFVLIITLIPVSKKTVQAADTMKVVPGTVSKNAQGKITFPNLRVLGNNAIKSVSIQFSSAVQPEDYIAMQVPAADTGLVEVLKNKNNTTGYDKHIIVNAKDNQTVTDAKWEELLRNNLTVGLADDDVKKVSFIVETEAVTKFIEFNYFNGHYYEVVFRDDDELGWAKDSVTWKEAYEHSKTRTYQGLPGYLVTITSKEENDFVVSICNTHTWLGTTSDSTYEYTYGKAYRDTKGGVASLYFTGGDEKGELMCTVKNGQGDKPVAVGNVMDRGYLNWDPNNHEPNFRDNATEGPEAYVNLYLAPLWGSKADTWNDLYNSGAGMIKSYVVEYGTVLNNGHTMENKSEVVINSKYELYANDFILTTDEAKNINDKKLIDYGNVSAAKMVDTDDKVDAKDEVVVSENNIVPIPGLYSVQYTVGDELTQSVTAKVVDAKGENTNGSGIAIYANGITLTTSQVAAGPDYIGLSGVKAKSLTTNKEITEIFVNSMKVQAKPGIYELTFSATENGGIETVTVPVTVIEDNEVAITASDFVIAKDKYLSNDEAKQLSGVSATKGTSPISLGDISVDLSGIPGNREVGKKYPVTFTTDGVDKTVYVTVVDEFATNDNNNVFIGANDFTISASELDKATTEERIKELSSVFAVNQNGTVRSDITVDASKLQKNDGVYDVTFTTGSGSSTASVTVKATVVCDIGMITAKDFVIGAGDAITSSDAVNLGNASATDKDSNTIGVTVNSDELAAINKASSEGKKGVFPLTFTSEEGLVKKINVTIKDKKEDNGTTDETQKDKIIIAANDFTIGTEDYSRLTPINVIKLSNGVAINETTHKPVAITTVDISKVENKPGVYPVTLATADGTSVTIKVTIDGNYKTVGDIDKAAESNEETGKTTVDNDTSKKTEDDSGTSTGQDKNEKPGTDGTNQEQNQNKPADTTGPDKLFEKTAPSDIEMPIDTGRTVQEVTVNDKKVSSGGYSVSNGKVIIKKTYAGTLAVGKYPVEIKYADGSKKTFKLEVVEFNAATVVKKVPVFKMNKTISVKSKFTLNLVGITKTAKVSFKTSNKKIATVNNKGVITGKKKGKCTVSGYVIQNGAYYKVNVKLKVVKKLKIYNLKKKALSKKSGELPEFNVYKRVFKNKKTKLKFTSVEKNAKISYKSSKKKIATVSKKGVITGKKKGFCVVTASITQNGKTFVTRIFVRVDDYTKNKQLKKYLK